jgi:hypothetical protein
VRTVLALLLIAACSKSGGGGGTGSAAPAAPGSAAPRKGGGFSASLSAELSKEGSGSAAAAGSAGSAVAAAPVGSNAGSNAVAMAKPADTKASPTNPTPTNPAPTTPSPTKPTPAAPSNPSPAATASRTPVKPPPEIAAIKMDLEPNWFRDLGEAATISFVLDVPNTGQTKLFAFHYGYDPASAPADRDAYKKWLADQKILNVTLDRQRGAAWYLEGTDGNGAPAFRYRITYGGKQLICYGSLYKDAASNPLGDLRDKVVMAGKKICETLTL